MIEKDRVMRYRLLSDKWQALWIKMNFLADKAEHLLVTVVYPRNMCVCHKRSFFFSEWKVKILTIATVESAMSMKCRVKVQKTKNNKM